MKYIDAAALPIALSAIFATGYKIGTVYGKPPKKTHKSPIPKPPTDKEVALSETFFADLPHYETMWTQIVPFKLQRSRISTPTKTQKNFKLFSVVQRKEPTTISSAQLVNGIFANRSSKHTKTYKQDLDSELDAELQYGELTKWDQIPPSNSLCKIEELKSPQSIEHFDFKPRSFLVRQAAS